MCCLEFSPDYQAGTWKFLLAIEAYHVIHQCTMYMLLKFQICMYLMQAKKILSLPCSSKLNTIEETWDMQTSPMSQ